jgi:GT2 family glycosyltransferase
LIVLLNWNGKKDTLECLSSLEKVTYRHFTPIVVDNGSTDDSVPAIRSQFPQVPIFETKENLGFAGGNNIGIAWGLKKSYEWILLLNNDTIVDPNFLEAFLAAAQERPKGKIFGAKIYRYHDPGRIDHLGGFWNPKIAEFESHAQNKLDDGLSFEEGEKVDYVCGACLFMHRSVPQAIGLLEPRFFLFWEETDFCSRARRFGFEVWTAPQAKIWHKVSASFTGGKPHMQYFWWRSRLLWIARNCSFAERKLLYQTILFPELWKSLRHYLLRRMQHLFRRNDATHLQKMLRYKASLIGALHYSLGRFGNCPKWLRNGK